MATNLKNSPGATGLEKLSLRQIGGETMEIARVYFYELQNRCRW